ncbi:hypothetical protein EV122DRAFT_285253 [Schizophyllum commune]
MLRLDRSGRDVVAANLQLGVSSAERTLTRLNSAIVRDVSESARLACCAMLVAAVAAARKTAVEMYAVRMLRFLLLAAPSELADVVRHVRARAASILRDAEGGCDEEDRGREARLPRAPHCPRLLDLLKQPALTCPKLRGGKAKHVFRIFDRLERESRSNLVMVRDVSEFVQMACCARPGQRARTRAIGAEKPWRSNFVPPIAQD